MTDRQRGPEEAAQLVTLFELARTGRTRSVIAAVDSGVPVNLTGRTGDTLLILAAFYGHPELVRALLDCGAATGPANDRGQTALSAAVFHSDIISVRALLAAGANPSGGNPSALKLARDRKLDDMLSLMEAAVADHERAVRNQARYL
jgi:ankyrin repeat protein